MEGRFAAESIAYFFAADPLDLPQHSISPEDLSTPQRQLSFRVREFARDVVLVVKQGKKVLHHQRFR